MAQQQDYDNKGGLWKGTVNHYGKLRINGVEYEAKLWKLAGGKGLLVLNSPDGAHAGAQIILYRPEKDDVKCTLSGKLGTKDNLVGYINVYKSDSTNEKAPALNLTFKPAGAPGNGSSSSQQTDHF